VEYVNYFGYEGHSYFLFFLLFSPISFEKFITKIYCLNMHDAPLNSLIDSNVNPKMKIVEGIGVHSFTHNTSGVKGCAGALKWGLG